MKKRWLALCLATVMAASLTACGSSKTSAPDTTGTETVAAGSETKAGGETKAEEAPAGAVEQVVTIPMFSDPDTLDPGRSDDEQKNAIVLEIQETLIRLMDGKVTPGGAESWETSDDGLVWTFKLRDNQYSDGTAVTAQDYVNSIRRIFDPEVNCHNAGIFYCIKGGEDFNTGKGSKEDVAAKAIDDKTLEITLTEPLPYFLQLMTFANVTPVPESKTQGEKNSSYGATAEELSSSGPFYASEWVRGSKIVLKKNPNYWDAANVKLETVNMVLAQDENTREQMFNQGQLDILRKVRSEYADTLKAKIDGGEVQLLEGPQPRYSYICFNNEDPNGIFTNEKIRMAFSIALDRESLVKNVMKKDQAAYGMIPYGLSIGEELFRDIYPEPMKDFLAQDPKALL